MNVSRRRRIAYRINNGRAHLKYIGDYPVYRWPVDRGSIPLWLWYRPGWRNDHISDPAFRNRMKWPRALLLAMPEYVLPDWVLHIIEDLPINPITADWLLRLYKAM